MLLPTDLRLYLDCLKDKRLIIYVGALPCTALKVNKITTLHSQIIYEMQTKIVKYLESTEKQKKKKYKRSCRKPTMLHIFFVFIFSLSWKFWPQLACEYASFAFLVSVFDLTLKKGKIKSSSCGFRTDILFLRKVFGSWPELHYMHFMYEGQIS